MRMRHIVLAGAVGVMAALAGVFWLGHREPATPGASMAAPDPSGHIERGRYLARLGNCQGCHTAPGAAAYSGNRALPTPFGTFYGPNLTPDAATGLGRWSSDDFWRALRHGKGRDGQLLYPAFPYTSYRHVSREDADALFAYLQSLPAVANPRQDHALAFPYSQRPLLAFWRAWFLDDAALPEAPPEASPAWLRGRYLVTGLAHCAECHTPRNRLGALSGVPLSGATMPGQGWFAPALTGDPATGLGAWSAEDIAALLQSGLAPRSHASGPMAESVHMGFQHASRDDLSAMAVYVKSLPAAGVDAAAMAPPAPASLLEAGARIYRRDCAQCHRDDGGGHADAWPPLAGNISVVAPSPANAIQMVLRGGFAPATAANPRPHGMPPFGPSLADGDVAAVVTFIRQSWGNQASAVGAADVRRTRESLR